MRQFLKKGLVRVTFDQNFGEVIDACQRPRPSQNGTWITGEMQGAYCTLHELGYAHSVEVWQDGALAGGLYGVSLGHSFFGESMFSTLPNASKVALITLVGELRKWGFDLIDCQVETAHLASLGARSIPRREFRERLSASLHHETHRENWGALLADHPEITPT